VKKCQNLTLVYRRINRTSSPRNGIESEKEKPFRKRNEKEEQYWIEEEVQPSQKKEKRS
jgi:hypothetical protein